jgi:hypothetical protein
MNIEPPDDCAWKPGEIQIGDPIKLVFSPEEAEDGIKLVEVGRIRDIQLCIASVLVEYPDGGQEWLETELLHCDSRGELVCGGSCDEEPTTYLVDSRKPCC